MKQFDVGDASPDPAIARVVSDVCAGNLEPAEGARRITMLWVPSELFAQAPFPMLLYTGEVNLRTWDKLAHDWFQAGHAEAGRRMAELDLLLADSLDDELLQAECAWTLAQFLWLDPDATSRRLDLLEFCSRLLSLPDHSEDVRAAVLFHLAQARFDNAPSGDSGYGPTVEACRAALALSSLLNFYQSGLLHFAAGTSLQETGRLSESCVHLEQAVSQLVESGHEKEGASALNNLGNSYRILGAQRGDPDLVRKALQCYDTSLPVREGSYLERTVANRAIAEELLRLLSDGKPIPEGYEKIAATGSTISGYQKNLIDGDRAYRESRRTSPPDEEQRATALTAYLHAACDVGRNAPARTRAEVFDRFGGLFFESDDVDELMTGVCFATAAARLGGNDWRDVSLARTQWRKGRMLVNIGASLGVNYLEVASSLLRGVLPTLRSEGGMSEAETAESDLALSLALQVVHGDVNVREEAMTRLGSERLRRLEVEGEEPGTLAAEFQHYFGLVRDLGPDALTRLLGEVALSEMQVLADNSVDDFNKALRLLDLSVLLRDVGDLPGTLEIIGRAEDRARVARYSAPSVWCRLAVVYANLTLVGDAERCLDEARVRMSLVVADEEWVPTGENSGRWMTEGPISSYLSEIEDTEVAVRACSRRPCFDVSASARGLFSGDEKLGSEFREAAMRAIDAEPERDA
jgi:tetratricopeptide (TPR) repeat protein